MANYTKDAEALADRVKKYCKSIGREVIVGVSHQSGHSRWTVVEKGRAKFPLVSWSAHSGHGLWQVKAEADLLKAGLLPPKNKKKKEDDMPVATAVERERSDALRPRLKALLETFPQPAAFCHAVVEAVKATNVEPFGGFDATSPQNRIIEVQMTKFVTEGKYITTKNLNKWDVLLPYMEARAGTQAPPIEEERPRRSTVADPPPVAAAPPPPPEPLEFEPPAEPSEVEPRESDDELLAAAEQMLKAAEEDRDAAAARERVACEALESATEALAVEQRERRRVEAELEKAQAASETQALAVREEGPSDRERELERDNEELNRKVEQMTYALQNGSGLTLSAQPNQLLLRYSDTLLRHADKELTPEIMDRLDRICGLQGRES